MANIMNHIAYLSQEIGARPANTEEEQRAAIYISDTLKKDARLYPEIEEFNCNSHPELTRAIYCTLTVLMLVLAHFVSALAIPAVIITFLMAGCMIAEAMGYPLLSRVFTRGISQNVVAKYVPPAASGGVARRRKIILVANYDSGKVRREAAGPLAQFMGIIQKAVTGAMVAIPVLLLIKGLFLNGDTGAIAMLFTVLLAIAGLLCLIPLILYILAYLAPFSDAANNNASGVAALLDIARMVGNDKFAGTADSTGVNHGEGAAAGVIPEGATLSYEAAMDTLTPEEQLIAAKAAIATMTGQPLTEEEEEITRALKEATPKVVPVPAPEMPIEKVVSEASQNIVDGALDGATMVADQAEAMIEGSEHDAPVEEVQPVAPVVKSPEDAIPDWYRQAKAAAKHSASIDEQPIHRSRYAVDEGFGEEDFLETAQAIMSSHVESEDIDLSRDERLLNLQADIMNAQAPHSVQGEDEKQSGIPEAVPFDPSEYMTAPVAIEECDQAVEAPIYEEHLTPEAPGAEVAAEKVFAEQMPAEQIPVAKEPFVKAPVAAPVKAAAPVEEMPVEVPVKAAAPVEETPVEAPVKAAAPDSGNAPVEKAEVAEPAKPSEPARAPRDVYYLSAEQAGALIMDPSLPIAPMSEEEKSSLKLQNETYRDSQQIPEKEVEDVEVPTVETPVVETPVVETPVVETPNTPLSADATTAMPAVAAGATMAMPAISPDKVETAPAAAPDATTAMPVMGALDLDALRQEAAAKPAVDVSNDATQKLPQRLIAEIAQPAAIAQERYAASTNDGISASMLPAIDINEFKQRAPLAAVAESDTQAAAQSLLATSLPTIESDIAPAHASHDVADVPLHVTSAFEPISIPESIIAEEESEEALDDFFVDDVEDSGYAQEFNDSSDFTSTGYVEMPQSRLSKFFGKFGRKKKRQEESASSWLGVEDDFDARTVGKDRGGWESFRDDDDDWEGGAFSNLRNRFTKKDSFSSDDYADDYDAQYDGQYDEQYDEQYDDQYDEQYDDQYTEQYDGYDSEYQDDGGATMAMPAIRNTPEQSAAPVRTAPVQDETEQPEPEQSQLEQAEPVQRNSVERESVEFGRQYRDQYADVYADQYGNQSREAFTAEQGEQSEQYEQMPEYQDENLPTASDEIFSFASGRLDTEVWFVALGSELAENGGMKAFMQRHAGELRGSVVINLESLGAGELCYLEEEGCLQTSKLSSRMKRYLRQAEQTSGINIEPAAITWRDTAASLAAKQRLQAVTLVGMDGAKPAGFGEVEDSIEDINPEVLRDNEHFIIDMMKAI